MELDAFGLQFLLLRRHDFEHGENQRGIKCRSKLVNIFILLLLFLPMGQLKISCFAGLVKFRVAGVAGHSELLQRSGCESPSKMHVVYLHFEENVANSYVAIAQQLLYKNFMSFKSPSHL
jgi:hypothetical protein